MSQATDPNPKLSAALSGRYVLERSVGSGGMARVYLARDLRHSRRVTIKLLAPEVARMLGPDRFSAEILVTANRGHQNAFAVDREFDLLRILETAHRAQVRAIEANLEVVLGIERKGVRRPEAANRSER